MSKRTDVLSVIESCPGIHFRGIVEAAGLAIGQGQYHVSALHKEGRVRKARLFGYVRYFPMKTVKADFPILAALRIPVCRKIIAHIASHEGMHCGQIEEHVRLAKSTVSWHLARLEREGVIRKVRHGRQVCVHFVDPMRVRSVL